MDQIKDKIYWIRIDKKKMKLLSKGNSKEETKKEIIKFIKNNNMNDAQIYRLIIEFHDDKQKFNWGIISFNLDFFKVVDTTLKKNNISGKYGTIWFERQWLQENGWDKKYISNVINKLRKDKGDIKIPGINLYHLFGKK